MLQQLQTLIDKITALTTVDEGMRAVVTTVITTLNDLRQQIADLAAQDHIDPAQLQDLVDKVGAVTTDFQTQQDALVAATKAGTIAANEPAADQA